MHTYYQMENIMPNILVKGMHCANCTNAVTKAILGVSGVKSASVDLASATASWENNDDANPASVETIKKAISAIGFDTD